MAESERAGDSVRHEPLEVTSVDGLPMVACSCDADDPKRPRWQSAYWLTTHWQGDQTSGITAIHAVIDRQREEADR